MSEYQFTQDWFSWALPVWEQLFKQMPERKCFLEIGVFEGRATTWLLENALEDNGVIVCIDTWDGGEEHIENQIAGSEERFKYNIKLAMSKYPAREVFTLKATSYEGLAQLATFHEEKYGINKFDFIYIDGSHQAPDVLTDACMAWPLLKKDGIMVFDDYIWGNSAVPLHRPKIAVDAFVNIFGESLDLVELGYQLIVQKVG